MQPDKAGVQQVVEISSNSCRPGYGLFKGPPGSIIPPMGHPAHIEFDPSDEFRILVSRADLAEAEARRLTEEIECWRDRAIAQLDYMFEIGADFRKRPGLKT